MKELNNILKKIDGNVLGIGINDEITDILNENPNILECFRLDSKSSKGIGEKGFSKKIKINKIKKVFNKKSLDYIIADIEELKPFLRTFVKNSIYLNNKKLYFYGNENIFELEELEKRYKRYGSTVTTKIDNHQFFMEINNEGIKAVCHKNLVFRIRDVFFDIFEYISELLIK